MSAITPLHPAGERLTLTEINDQLDRKFKELTGHIISTVGCAREIGELLERAKEQVNKQFGHGYWLPWLKENCPAVGVRSAQGYMRVSNYFAAHPDQVEELSSLTFRAVLEAIADPKSETGCVFDDPTQPLTVVAETIGPLESDRIIGPLQPQSMGTFRPSGSTEAEQRVTKPNRFVTYAPQDQPEARTRVIVRAPPAMTLDEALQILSHTQNCRPIVDLKYHQRMSRVLRAKLKKSDAKLSEAEKRVILAATMLMAVRAKQAKA
jgi:hypothetical protein